MFSCLVRLIRLIIAAEVVFCLRTKYRSCGIEIVATVKKSTETIRSQAISDRSKEKVLQRCAASMFVQSLILFGFIVLTVSPLGIIVIIIGLNGGDLLQFVLTPAGIFLSILSAAIYVVVRKLVTSG